MASIFMQVIEVGADCLLLCFLIDKKVNKGGNMRASATLQRLVGETTNPNYSNYENADGIPDSELTDSSSTHTEIQIQPKKEKKQIKQISNSKQNNKEESQQIKHGSETIELLP